MKKLLALVLALMLLMVSAAFAEEANIVEISNFTLTMEAGEEKYEADLSGLNARIAAGFSGELPTVQMDVDHDGEALMGAVMQFIDGSVLLGIDGVSRPFAAETTSMTSMMPAGGYAGGDVQESMVELFQNLDQLSNVKLPAFSGVTIPKIDLLSALSSFGVSPVTGADGVQSAQFSLSASQMKYIINIALKSLPAETLSQVQAMTGGELDRILSGEIGLALSANITDDGKKAEMLVDFYPVQNSVAATSPAACLFFSSEENSDTLQLQVYEEGARYTVGQIDLVSDPAAATLTLSLNLAQEAEMSFMLYPDNGAQVAELRIAAGGETASFSVNYGEEGETEYFSLNINIPSQNMMLSLYDETTPTGNGDKEGLLALSMSDGSSLFDLTADVLETKGDVAFRNVQNVENAIDARNMTEEQAQSISGEMEKALSGLVSYLQGIEMRPAA
ncbi:MAG: hypothetical protein J5998_11685 [Clostridia bacterium]|nr:hypothetical protein [Clostridia bacterium]